MNAKKMKKRSTKAEEQDQLIEALPKTEQESEQGVGPQDQPVVEELSSDLTEPTPKEMDSGDEPSPAEKELSDRLLRLQADFENFRRRTQRERSELYQRANENLIEELLSVLDHFELGFENAEKHEANPDVVIGFRLVFEQIQGALAKFNLHSVDAVGEHFDPHLHEAITHVSSEEYPADLIVAQTRRGYRLSDKLLRPAQVVVSKGPGPEEKTADEEDAGSSSTLENNMAGQEDEI